MVDNKYQSNIVVRIELDENGQPTERRGYYPFEHWPEKKKTRFWKGSEQTLKMVG